MQVSGVCVSEWGTLVGVIGRGMLLLLLLRSVVFCKSLRKRLVGVVVEFCTDLSGPCAVMSDFLLLSTSGQLARPMSSLFSLITFDAQGPTGTAERTPSSGRGHDLVSSGGVVPSGVENGGVLLLAASEYERWAGCDLGSSGLIKSTSCDGGGVVLLFLNSFTGYSEG